MFDDPFAREAHLFLLEELEQRLIHGLEFLSREGDVKDSSEKVCSSLHKASLIEDVLLFVSIFILSVVAIEGTLDCVAEIYAKFKHTHASRSV